MCVITVSPNLSYTTTYYYVYYTERIEAEIKTPEVKDAAADATGYCKVTFLQKQMQDMNRKAKKPNCQ